jgi:hypothetical protein
VKIGGFALQRKDSFEDEFDRIVRAVGGPDAGTYQPEPDEKVGRS